MVLTITPARRHILSGLFVNLAAAWLAAAALTPNFVSFEEPGNFLMLTYDVLGGILLLVSAVMIEEGL